MDESSQSISFQSPFVGQKTAVLWQHKSEEIFQPQLWKGEMLEMTWDSLGFDFSENVRKDMMTMLDFEIRV